MQELVAICYRNGGWIRNYFIPAKPADWGPLSADDQVELLTRALGWAADQYAQATGPEPRALVNSTGQAWKSMVAASWDWPVLDDSQSLIGTMHLTLNPYKLTDNRSGEDYYLLETIASHDSLAGWRRRLRFSRLVDPKTGSDSSAVARLYLPTAGEWHCAASRVV